MAPTSTKGRGQAEAGPVGSVDTAMPPSPLTATQSMTVGQETPVKVIPWATVTLVHCAVALVGWVEVRTWPLPSTATQSLGEGQEMAVSAKSSPPALSIWCTRQAEGPPVGWVEVMTSPTESPATHSFGDGQETDSMGWVTSSPRDVVQGRRCAGGIDRGVGVAGGVAAQAEAVGDAVERCDGRRAHRRRGPGAGPGSHRGRQEDVPEHVAGQAHRVGRAAGRFELDARARGGVDLGDEPVGRPPGGVVGGEDITVQVGTHAQGGGGAGHGGDRIGEVDVVGRPGRGHRIGGDEHAPVVVAGHAQGGGRTRQRDERLGVDGGGGPRRRVGLGVARVDAALFIAGHAEAGGDAGKREPGPAHGDRRPGGRGPVAGIGRGEDVALGVDGQAQAGGRTGDVIEADGTVDVDHGPRRWCAAGIGGGEDVAVVGDGDAQRRRGTRDPGDLAAHPEGGDRGDGGHRPAERRGRRRGGTEHHQNGQRQQSPRGSCPGPATKGHERNLSPSGRFLGW